MSVERLSLSDCRWRITWSEHGEDVPYAEVGLDDSSWLPASVPGDAHLDLMAAGLIPEPFVGTNTDACLWMEEKDWWCRGLFEVPESWAARDGRSIRLVFQGLDCFATVWLNGVELAGHANMFTPLEVDVTDRLRLGGENVLAVRLASPTFAPLASGRRKIAKWGFPRELSRKAQMSYGWDIAPRLVTVGIWRPVELLCVEGVRISDCWVRTVGLEPGSAEMAAVIEVEAVTPPENGVLRVAFEAAGEVREAECRTGPGGLGEVRFEWAIDDPELWWPNGSGEPHLYEYRARVLTAGGVLVHERTGTFGVRTVGLDRSATAGGGHLFRFSVNGREIFMRGFNWTPPDAIFARATPERRRRLLEAARDSGANMLRIWGGGVYEAEDLFEEADRMGLLVWQDFMFSCAPYPQDAEFLSEVRTEAEHVVRQLRRHPCLALWCGDNECDFWYGGPAGAEKENLITRSVLPEVAARLDPGTPYVPTAPHSPACRRYNDETDSDCHLWRHGASYNDPYFLESPVTFISETGFLSVPGLEVVRQMVGLGGALWPPESREWRHHSANCTNVKEFRGMEKVAENLAACGRPPADSLEEMVEVSQELQAEACRTWIDHAASRPECGGILIWNLCDCWPQMSDAVIAYPLRAKKALAAVREAFAGIGRL